MHPENNSAKKTIIIIFAKKFLYIFANNFKKLLMKQKLTQLSELGEFKVIELLTSKNITYNNSTKKSVGDDAAVIFFGDEYQIVITNDLLVEGIHFDLAYTPLKYLGYKAVVVNLSDVYAMNAIPEQILVSFAVSNRFSYEALEMLYEGIYEACKNYKVDLVGGDVTSSKLGMFLSITAVGKAKKHKLVYRNGAKKGDLICVTGDLGAAYMGLQLLIREKRIAMQTNKQPDWTGYEYILQRQLKPDARKDIIEYFDQKGFIPNAMIDISDGLSSEIIHICTQSNCGAVIYESEIPIDIQTNNLAVEMNLSPTTVALHGGEDYELLFTINPNDEHFVASHPDIHIIGHITDTPGKIDLVARDGTTFPIIAQGWNSFQENINSENKQNGEDK